MLSNWFYKFKIGRTITALNSLDDATLKDIGIHRSNIKSHAYEVFKNEKARARSYVRTTRSLCQVYLLIYFAPIVAQHRVNFKRHFKIWYTV